MQTAPAQLSPHGFDLLYGLELIELGERHARGRVGVREELKEPGGAVHGGVFAAIGGSLATLASARAVSVQGKAAAALSLQTSLLRPITEGVIDATAVPRHQGRTTWVWEVEFADERGRLCALCRVTVALRDGSGPV